MAGELSYGREMRACAISAFCPVASTAARATSTIWMRLRAHPRARPGSVPCCGRKPAIYVILGRCQVLCRVWLVQSTILGMLSVTRKGHGACALLWGREQLECKI